MRTLIVILCSIFFLSQIQAQKSNSYRGMLSIEFGINAANQQIRRYSQGTFLLRNGIRGGVFWEKPHSKRLTFLGGLSYVESGSNDRLFRGESELLQYAEFSFRAKEYLPIGGSDMFFSLGPYFSYGIGGYRKDGNGQMISNNPFKDPQYNSFEWGLGGNIGVKFPWGTYLQFGLQTAFNNCFVSEQFSYFNFGLMATAGHTINWGNFKTKRK